MLVRQGVLEDVRAAAELSTTVWGGISYPMIPVSDDPERACQLIRNLEVDVVYPVVDDPCLAQVVARFPHIRARYLMGDSPFVTLDDDRCGLVDVRSVVDHYYQTTFRYGSIESNVIRPVWDDDDALAYLHTIVFGHYPSSAFGERCDRALRGGLQAKERLLAPHVPRECARRLSPIGCTADQLSKPRAWRDDYAVILGKADDFDMLVAYWNLRATGCNVVAWPDETDRYEEYVLEHLRSWTHPEGEKPTVTVWMAGETGRTASLPLALKEHFNSIGAEWMTPTLRAEMSLGQGSSAVWEGPSHSVLTNVDREGSRVPRLSLALPATPFTSAQFEGFFRPRWIVTVEGLTDYEDPKNTLRVPSFPDLNDWAADEMCPVNDVRLASGKVGIMLSPSDTSLFLWPVTDTALVGKLMERSGLTIARSSAGEAVARIVAQMGGLHACRLFRLPGVRALLARPERSRSWDDALRTIHDGGTYAQYRNVRTAADTFRRLLEKGVFQAALHLQCPACQTRDRYPLEAIATEVHCPRCDTAFLLAPHLELGRWEYRASGFFAHSREHGAIPVILTMLRLSRFGISTMTAIVPSHRIKGLGIACETDLIGLEEDHDGRVALVLGECKGGQETIEADDLAKLDAAASAVRSADMECYVVLSTTRDAFSEQELDLFRSHPQATTNLILFTSHDMRSYNDYPHALTSSLPVRHPLRLAEIARNSHFLYLTADGARLRAIGADEELLI